MFFIGMTTPKNQEIEEMTVLWNIFKNKERILWLFDIIQFSP